MKVTLQVDGHELSLDEVETIVREYFSRKDETEQTTQKETKLIPRPTGGFPFKVNPLEIDRKLFQEVREDCEQEKMRNLILEAFSEVDAQPQKYGKPFKTLFPTEKPWEYTYVYILEKFASELGGHNANWVEQALEWAQRIQNGETWDSICKRPDTAKWYRLVLWKNGIYRVVGGSLGSKDFRPASYVHNRTYFSMERISDTVELVVLH